MSEKYNIDNAKKDIENLQDQNSYDFQEIKRLDRLINEYDKRVSQAINMNNQINKKIQDDYEAFKKSIIDDNLDLGNSGSSGSIRIVDNLNSTSTTSALSANQGRVIKLSLDNIANRVNSTSFINQNGGGTLKFWVGTQLEYDDLIIKYDDFVYLIEGNISSEIIEYTVTNNLTNCTNSNIKTVIYKGSSYTGVITANSGYQLSNVVITMNDVNITNTCYNDGNIIIGNVNGNINIMATATIINEDDNTNNDEDDNTNNDEKDNTNNLVYKLENQVVLDGKNTIDTNYSLFDKDKDFTIFFDFKTDFSKLTISSPENYYQYCVFKVKQTKSPWIGVDCSIHVTTSSEPQGRGEIIGDNRNGYYLGRMSTGVISNSNDRQKYIIKRVASEKKMYFYDNKGLIGSYPDAGDVATNTFNTKLIIGGFDDGSTRKIQGTIYQFKIYDKAIDDEYINELLGVV